MKMLTLSKESSMDSKAEIKSVLHRYIVETEDLELLKQAKEYFRSLLKNRRKIIGYTSDGYPLDIEAYKKEIDEARQQVKEGKTISQEQIEKASENW
jgi:hypothetical protein